MKKEDKELLLVDLCARLTYGVICQVDDGAAGLNDGKLVEIDISKEKVRFDVDYYWDAYIDDVKPYLRPMSSMTKEEVDIFMKILSDVSKEVNDNTILSTYKVFDYCNSIHVDYRGLIDKGLAIEAPGDMYKD